MDFSFAILPRQTVIPKPAERTLNNPALGYDRQLMYFMAFYSRSLRSNHGFNTFGKTFPRVSAVR
jgi:hypothetical protein